jgi:hypothetical protein
MSSFRLFLPGPLPTNVDTHVPRSTKTLSKLDDETATTISKLLSDNHDIDASAESTGGASSEKGSSNETKSSQAPLKPLRPAPKQTASSPASPLTSATSPVLETVTVPAVAVAPSDIADTAALPRSFSNLEAEAVARLAHAEAELARINKGGREGTRILQPYPRP